MRAFVRAYFLWVIIPTGPLVVRRLEKIEDKYIKRWEDIGPAFLYVWREGPIIEWINFEGKRNRRYTRIEFCFARPSVRKIVRSWWPLYSRGYVAAAYTYTYKKSKQRGYLEVSEDPSTKTCSYPNKGREANGRGDMIKITNVIANC